MNKTSSKALWFQDLGKALIKTETLPSLLNEYCEIQTEYSAISLGTEKLVFNGQIPKELWKEMACPYMRGDFSFPIQYGYSLVGRVIKGPQNLLGRRAHVLHPHQDLCQVRVQDIHLVPDNIPSERATLASNLETVINAIWDSCVQIGDWVLIVGFGGIGSLLAHVLQNFPGISLTIVDISEQKREIAYKMGFDCLDPSQLFGITQKWDLAFHSSATQLGLQTAIDLTGVESKIIELSWYGTHPVNIMLGSSFHSKRKQILSSQVSTIALNQRARWNYTRRKDLVFHFLQNPSFDEHITHRVAFDALPDFYPSLEQIGKKGLYCVVHYS